MKIVTEFDLKDIVYLKTDDEKKARIITQINVTPDGMTYSLNQAEYVSVHYACEITRDNSDIISFE